MPTVTGHESIEARFPDAKVQSRLLAYDDATVARLHAMLTAWATGEVTRAEGIERKATALLGYGGGIVAVAIPWLHHHGAVVNGAALWISTCLAMIGIAFAFCVFAAHAKWPRVTDVLIFPRVATGDAFDGKEALMHSARLMHELYADRRECADGKGGFVLVAQAAIVASVLVIGLGLML